VIQIVQNMRDGKLRVADVPPPLVRPGFVLIENVHSVISAGTEKSVIDTAGKSLLAKARERPEQVLRVLKKLTTEGLVATYRQVTDKLNDPIALGYSSAGTVLAVGPGVQGLRPGDRVASNGPHAGVVCVPKHLCAVVPATVALEQAAFTTISSIALQGVRLGRLGIGDAVLVVGLGLIGQITVKLLKAHGCRVIGTDLDPTKCELAKRWGADQSAVGVTADDVKGFTRGFGADAVLITAATKSDQPVQLAGEAVRAKGRVVIVGAVGLNVPRQPYFLREAELVISCSYGAGRYDPEYEDRGHDYPIGYARWTEQRNMEAVLSFMESGALDLQPLITHRFEATNAAAAYSVIEHSTESYLGIVLGYGDGQATKAQPIAPWVRPAPSDRIGVGCIGAGGFGRAVILPNIRKVGRFHPRLICSGKGLSALTTAERMGFDQVVSDEDTVVRDPGVQAVFILTRHDQHARQVLAAIKARKHVFVEKPLAITMEELAEIEQAIKDAGSMPPLVMVGFNRRFSPAARAVKRHFGSVRAPLTVSIRFNAGLLPADHWTQVDTVGGGRIIGEACHAIDLATYLVGSIPIRVFAESIGGSNAPAITDDQCFITMRHNNGAISNIAYTAGGDRALPKERVEVFGGGRAGVIDDFREHTLYADGKADRSQATQQDKGHLSEIEAFAAAVGGRGPAPISWEELRSVSAAAILASRSIREGFPIDIPG
jgi:predicted dehydrogenase/threonine dehydrogenase-like Zn-dependent dehydrogenase